MKYKNITAGFSLLCLFLAGTISCKKADSEKEWGFSKIYMPQAILKSGGVNNNYPVPSGVDSSSFNYKVNPADKKVEVILGANLSGPAAGAYSVDIQVNNDTVQQLLGNNTFDRARYMLMPQAMYALPSSLDIPAGQRSGTFNLSIDIQQLKSNTYAGKFLLLAVKLANSTKSASNYELNTALATTIVIVDVNALVIGPAVNVTGQYFQNPGNPFVRDALQPGQTRWANLKGWQANAAAQSHGGFGGWSSDNGGVMNMESGWGSPQILNGKIYQALNLPAGRYSFDISGGNWSGGENFLKDPAYAIVAVNADVLPDFNNILNNSAIYYETLTKGTQAPVVFTLGSASKVTLGVVVNYVQTEQGFKSKQVTLQTFPKAL
jgi:hypothetical protein